MPETKIQVSGYGRLYDLSKVVEGMDEAITLVLAEVEPDYVDQWKTCLRHSMTQHIYTAKMAEDPLGSCYGFLTMKHSFNYYPFGAQTVVRHAGLDWFMTNYGEALDHVDPLPVLIVGTRGGGQGYTQPGLKQPQAAAIITAATEQRCRFVVDAVASVRNDLPDDVPRDQRLGYRLRVTFPHQYYGRGEGTLRLVWSGEPVGKDRPRRQRFES